MTCYHPMKAVQEEPGQKPRFNVKRGEENLALPCGQCVGCKSARSTQWARRCAHEAKVWANNTAITLTYDNEHLPPGGHLDAAEFANFFKRLRRAIQRGNEGIATDINSSIRYFGCGEYGEEYQRPHYHSILFNVAFNDRYKVAVRNGRDYYRSNALQKLWQHGTAECSDATPAAANYIAQYSLKKQDQPDDPQYGRYRVMVVDPETGELERYAWRYKKQPPFLRMSTKPAIGYGWLERWKNDLSAGYLVTDGKKCAIPRSYLQKLGKIDPELAEEIRFTQKWTPQGDRNEPDRLEDAEKIHRQKKQQQHRKH